MDNNKPLEILKTPITKGGYRFGNVHSANTVQINLAHKPNWFHRQCMRIFLGLYWVDYKKEI